MPHKALFRATSHPFAGFAAALTLAVLWPWAVAASDIETAARSAIILDFDTGTEILAKEPDKLIGPASMSKMMTVYMLFDRLQSGGLSLDDTFLVSEKAWRKGGSKMWVEVGSRVRVEDLIRGIIVQSGNDASIVVAEGLAGSEEAFAAEMTRKAHALGMTSSTFSNASGWPDPEHLSTTRDLARLTEATIRDFPEYYHYYAETTFTYSNITQPNRNPLLYRNNGADGLKTGHTDAAGYGLAASAKRGDRRIILVVSGLDSERARTAETERLMDWAFREFDNYRLFGKGETVTDASVWLGQQATVPLIVDSDMQITMHRRTRQEMEVKAVYDTPVPAPVRQGTPLGRLIVSAPGMQPVEMPLLAGADIPKLGLFGRLGAAMRYLVFGAGSTG